MKLSETKLGDVIYTYLTDDEKISERQTSRKCKTTIIGVHNDGGRLLGWIGSDPKPRDTNSFGSANCEITYIENHEKYDRYFISNSVMRTSNWQVEPFSSITNGHTCKKCGDTNPYVEHDLSKGPFICTGCKLWRSILG